MSKDGVSKIHGLGEIADWEKELLDSCLKDLAANIKKVFPLSAQLTHRARTLLPRILDKSHFSHSLSVKVYYIR